MTRSFTALSYTVDDRVQAIAYPNNKTNAFLYNGLGLRVQKVDNSGPNGSAHTYTYLTDGADPASPVLKDGDAVYTPGLSERRTGIGAPTGQYGPDTFYHLDSLGSTRLTTNNAQYVEDEILYDAFGNLVVRGLSDAGDRAMPTPTPFLWGGSHQYQADYESGLYLLGNRYFDATTGRFISQDPAQDESNWYAYCGNNPLVAVDPSGLSAIIIIRSEGGGTLDAIMGNHAKVYVGDNDKDGTWYGFYSSATLFL